MCPAVSSRWCPTPEQLMILEEMYRSGIRTPNATQIQQITAHLAFYGRVEGKNVFYWFQNHKARDRQKLRKKLARQLHHNQQQHQQLQLQPQPQPQPQQAMYQPYYNISNYHHRQLLLHNHHNQYQRCAHHDHMFLPLDSSSDYYSNPSALRLPRQGINGGQAQSQLGMKEYQYCNNGNAWKMDNNIINNPGENPTFRGSSYSPDWTMMMMDMGPPPSYPSSLSFSSSSLPCCSITIPRPPLKTLELFPISSSNFKDNTTKP